MSLLLKNAAILDTRGGSLSGGDVLVRDGAIAEVGKDLLASADETIDLGGRVLMPGLCDGHVHVIAVTADFSALQKMSPFYVSARAAKIVNGMLHRGFTTVRDAGGCDFGLARAVNEGFIEGPRILFCGHALSQTGGHGDMRSPGENELGFCFCCAGLGLVCDGVAEVRRAAREEIRKGATQIKIMASGGVASPTDRIDSTQFSREEIAAVVEEADAANVHVMAHAYTARAINRALELGVRTIEHGNLMDEESCRLFLETGSYLVPTLSTYAALAEEGVEAGMPRDIQVKVYEVLDAGRSALELAHRRKVPMVYGSDLLGSMHRHQLNEINIRREVVPADDLIRAATCNAADAFGRTGEFGEIVPGARADLLVSAGNPLEDITVLTRPEENLLAILKEGRFHKNLIH
jgi:imidazolonepropionase-like amidohydrolase